MAAPPPPGLQLDRLQALVQRRHAEVERAIAARQWFDPWIFELETDAGDKAPLPSQLVLPWVAGFCVALEAFPALLQIDDPRCASRWPCSTPTSTATISKMRTICAS